MAQQMVVMMAERTDGGGTDECVDNNGVPVPLNDPNYDTFVLLTEVKQTVEMMMVETMVVVLMKVVNIME